MDVRCTPAPAGTYDAIIRFLPVGTAPYFKDSGIQCAYSHYFDGDDIPLTHKEIRCLRLKYSDQFCHLVLIGFDNSAPAPFDDLRQVTAKLGTLLADKGTSTVLFDWLDTLTFAHPTEIVRQIFSILPLCEYSFSKYLTAPKKQLRMQVALLAEEALQPFASEGITLASAVATCRDLVNEIADVMTPSKLAEECVRLGKEYGFQTEVMDKAACKEMGMDLFLAVSQGSVHEPKLIVMRWNGAGSQPPIAFVGKGITYDSGGLSLKTSSMDSMRFDMNGAASVIGAMCAIAAQKLPCNVVAAVAACENMIDAASYRNGDIFRSMNGQTVYVRNTDAEGRLTMADAITYCIRKEAPSELIEVAGLTGSVCTFFGSVCAAALTTDQVLFDRIADLMPVTGEKYAQMPCFEEYKALLKSPYADLNNSPLGGVGGILAGLFLAAFHENTPFLHIDYGAMPFTSKKTDCQPEGATGFGVKTLYYYAKTRGSDYER